MNIYYTAKDIEALVSKGIYEIELGPNTSLTDFARETAEQLSVVLLDGTQVAQEPAKVTAPPSPSPTPQAVSNSQTYNKPRGCQSGTPKAVSRSTSVSENKTGQNNSAPVNRLVDLMGKIIKRGD